MSDQLRIAIVGSTGLVGRAIMEEAVGRSEYRILAISRREAALPAGARMEMVVCEPKTWSMAIDTLRPDVLVCALGTTWKKAGQDEAQFRAVDQELVIKTAQAAHAAGVKHMILVSAIGANAQSRNFYLRVKGEVESSLAKIGFKRLDILRPGLLRGSRQSDRRIMERLGKLVSPATDLLLNGKWRDYRSVSGQEMAQAALNLATRRAPGKFIHAHDAIMRAIRIGPDN